ncbi:stalk domain-containing protein [Paenibacillus flagellatus]|uniref:Copper amine oxidase-like N-terminal domain-containing protein n=1 Tax=Paenibacillus flagellatus TaxID=2211139 RepID=A0A2V5K1X7_9BACL|nr:stalk domain-containing protein [Paenibacillus flagellatus]PYI51513.1 hypothetical protein DLM86_24125 [Paenibacillus flagellatus]
MKIKYAAASVLLVLGCAGVVQASSLHGDFNGDPIVNVIAGGKKLLVEDVPAVIREGRTLVPLYLLKQAGVDVKWDADNYNVELTLPDPSQSFSGNLKKMNEQAKEHEAGNVRLTYNEYGPYLQVDLKKANDSNKDNDRILALSKFLIDSTAETLVIDIIHLDDVAGRVIVRKADALEFHNKKLEDYKFVSKWERATVEKWKSGYVPNKPPEPETPQAQYPGMACREMIAAYDARVREAVANYNRNNPNNPQGLEQYIEDFKKGMNTVLKEANCGLLE